MTTLVQKDLEAKVSAAVAAALDDASVTDFAVRTAYGTLEPGEVAGEDVPVSVAVSVAAASPVYTAYGLPDCEISVGVALVVRRDMDVRNASLPAVVAALESLFLRWQLCTDDSVHTELSTSEFSADGFRLDNGPPPSVDAARKVATWTRTLAVKGVITPITSTTNN